MGRGCQVSQVRFGALLGTVPEPLELLLAPGLGAGFSVLFLRVVLETLKAAGIAHLVPSHLWRKGLSEWAGCCSWGCRGGRRCEGCSLTCPRTADPW